MPKNLVVWSAWLLQLLFLEHLGMGRVSSLAYSWKQAQCSEEQGLLSEAEQFLSSLSSRDERLPLLRGDRGVSAFRDHTKEAWTCGGPVGVSQAEGG